MVKSTGLGMSAFFNPPAGKPSAPSHPATSPRIRTTISLSPQETEQLDLLRMRLRQREGRGLTYGDVIGVAIRRLAQEEGIAPEEQAR